MSVVTSYTRRGVWADAAIVVLVMLLSGGVEMSAQETIVLKGHNSTVYMANFNQDGSRVVSASGDRFVNIWNPTSGESLKRYFAHNTAAYTARFSPDDSYIITSGWDGFVLRWNSDNGTIIDTVLRHDGDVLSLSYSGDGRRIITGGRDPNVIVSDPETGTKHQTIETGDNVIHTVALNRDGSIAATGTNDGIVRLWSVADGSLLRELNGHEGTITWVEFHPDGQRLASAGRDAKINIWDVSSGENLKELTEHLAAVHSVQFNKDGSLMLSASADATAKVWDVDELEVADNLEQHNGAVRFAAFGPDSGSIITAGGDNDVIVWYFNSNKIELIGIVDNTVDFGQVELTTVGTTTITIRNIGNEKLSVSGVTLVDNDHEQFILSKSLPDELEADATEKIELRFQPSTTGTTSAQVLITLSGGSPFFIDIVGEGIPKRTSAVQNDPATLAASIDLHFPVPNPASEVVMLGYELKRPVEVQLSLVDINARVLVELPSGDPVPGLYTQEFDVSRLNAGTYFLVVSTPFGQISRPLVVSR